MEALPTPQPRCHPETPLAMHPGKGKQLGRGMQESTDALPGWDLSRLQPQPQQTPWQFQTCKDQLPFHLGKSPGRQEPASREH